MNLRTRESCRKGTICISSVTAFGLKVMFYMVVLIFMAGFQAVQSQEAPAHSKSETSKSVPEKMPEKATPLPCLLPPIVVPTLPDKVPGYTELDPDTQLHVTGTPQVVDLETYTLAVTGKVAHSLKLKYDDLRCMPKIEARPTLVCPGFFRDTANWGGASLKYVLELAGLQEGANRIRLVSADGYEVTVPMEKALSGDNFLAYELEDKPIPVLHGFPVRAIFAELAGNKWVKWLVEIAVE